MGEREAIVEKGVLGIAQRRFAKLFYCAGAVAQAEERKAPVAPNPGVVGKKLGKLLVLRRRPLVLSQVFIDDRQLAADGAFVKALGEHGKEQRRRLFQLA